MISFRSVRSHPTISKCSGLEQIILSLTTRGYTVNIEDTYLCRILPAHARDQMLVSVTSAKMQPGAMSEVFGTNKPCCSRLRLLHLLLFPTGFLCMRCPARDLDLRRMLTRKISATADNYFFRRRPHVGRSTRPRLCGEIVLMCSSIAYHPVLSTLRLLNLSKTHLAVEIRS